MPISGCPRFYVLDSEVLKICLRLMPHHIPIPASIPLYFLIINLGIIVNQLCSFLDSLYFQILSLFMFLFSYKHMFEFIDLCIYLSIHFIASRIFISEFTDGHESTNQRGHALCHHDFFPHTRHVCLSVSVSLSLSLSLTLSLIISPLTLLRRLTNGFEWVWEVRAGTLCLCSSDRHQDAVPPLLLARTQRRLQ